MTRLLLVLLVPTLLTLLPYPAAPTPTNPLTSSEMEDIWDDTQDIEKLLMDAALPPTAPLSDSLDDRFASGDVNLDRFRPSPSRLRSSSRLSLLFPSSSSTGREDSVRTVVGSEAAFSSPLRLGPQKRSRVSLCHVPGFPMTLGCPKEKRVWRVPQTRSGPALQTAQRKSSPSLYLFGGAIGR